MICSLKSTILSAFLLEIDFFSTRRGVAFVAEQNMNGLSEYIEITAKSVLLDPITVSWPNSLKLLTSRNINLPARRWPRSANGSFTAFNTGGPKTG